MAFDPSEGIFSPTSRRRLLRPALYIGVPLLLFLLFISPPAQPHLQTAQRYLPFSGTSRRVSPWPRPPSPNPYKEPGIYQANYYVPEENRWVPLDPSVSAPPPLVERARKGPEEAGEDMGWLQNRTVVLFGDSISRHHTEHFCQVMGLKMRVVMLDDPLYPRYAFERERDAVPHIPSASSLSRPWLCEVPAWNFTIMYYWAIGEDDSATKDGENWSVGGFWPAKTHHYSPPSLIEDRIRSVGAPLLQNLNRTPDLIEFSTSAWDLDLLKIDNHDKKKAELVAAGVDETEAERQGGDAVKTPLSFEWLSWWRGRTLNTLRVLRETFGPVPPIQYRIFHQTGQNDAYPHLFVHHRTAALNAAARSVPGIEIDPWGDNIRGQELLQDWIHPSQGPGYLWSEMMLFRLWEAVTDAQEGLLHDMLGDVEDLV